MQEVSLTAGLLAGVAGSLHCVGACLGVSAAMLFSGRTPAPMEARCLCLLHLGRIATYVAAGAVAGSAGGLLMMLRIAGLNEGLRWATAVVMVWTGLTVAGFVPSIRLPVRLPGALSSHRTDASPLLLGIGWGLIPCGMAYLAMFSAALSGDALAGAAYMAAFALGTLPALAATSLGVVRMAGATPRRVHRLRIGIGTAVTALGLAALVPIGGMLSIICGGT